MLWEARQWCTPSRARVQEYQTRAAALQQVVRHAAYGRVHTKSPEVVKSGVIDPEVGLWRVADVEPRHGCRKSLYSNWPCGTEAVMP